ncbi:MAG: S1 RNA-binding domain-containing protein [Oscillospiraceae bacterium]|nr:S1 RNA-binding domain-containing protein [Oscillospiraceae bacterium]MBP1577656.1 S1 RNA-binding domain-containing protein [Oscillospiraceae bacterium]
MSVEIGSIVEGKVTGITNFGAFVELPDGKTGMVHISEVAATYVENIRDYIQENQTVRVKVLAVTPEGRINLSVKRAVEQPAQRSNNNNQRPARPAPPKRFGPGADIDFSRQNNAPQSFEDMMAKFKQTSDDKMLDIRRNLDGKRGSATPKRHNSK